MASSPPVEPETANPWNAAARIWLFPVLLSPLLKTARVEPFFEGSALGHLDVVRPEILSYLAALLVTAWLLGLCRTPVVRGLTAAGAWGLACLFMLMEVAAWYFVVTTGVHLDAPMVGLGLGRLGEVAVVVNSEVSVGLSGVLFMIGAIWLATVVLAKPWLSMSSAPSVKLTPVALVLALLALPTPGSVVDRAVARSTLVQALLTLPIGGGGAPIELEEPDAWQRGALLPHGERRFRNVTVIWLESIGWDATSLGELGFETTPVLAELAKHSLVAENAWSVVPHSTKSTVSIYCGVPPRDTMHVLESEVGGVPVRCQPHMLREQGYDTLMMRSATRHFEGWTQLIENVGFETFVSYEDLDREGFEMVNYFGYEDDVLLPFAEEWIEQRERPWYVTYMTGTAHHDYTLPTAWERTTYVETDDRQDRFLNAVAYVDRFVGKVIEQHKRLGVYEDTVYVLVADHGEAFGEHGRFQHDSVPYEEVLHVPLLIHAPGLFEDGVRIDTPVSQLDIAPTIADLLGFDLDAPGRTGRSLLQPLDDERVLHAHCWYQDRCQAARRGRYKLVHHYGNMDDELFDLVTDPHERTNIASEHPQIVEALRGSLERWSDEIDARYHGTP